MIQVEYTELDNYFEYDENELEEQRKYLIVVIYDISSTKRRNKLWQSICSVMVSAYRNPHLNVV